VADVGVRGEIGNDSGTAAADADVGSQGGVTVITVLDFGRPSISGSIRSIKMYSWA
jgi:hypothetical protein